MKHLLLALLMLFTVASCLPEKKGKGDPEPELAGTYQMTRLISASNSLNTSLPATLNGRQVSGEVIVGRVSDTRISIQFDLIISGQRQPGRPVTLDIRKASGKDYDIVEDGSRVGYINGTDFSIDYSSSNGREAITARK